MKIRWKLRMAAAQREVWTGTELRRLVIHDRLAQTVAIEFSHAVRNARVKDSELSFRPPAGTDLIGKPLPP